MEEIITQTKNIEVMQWLLYFEGAAAVALGIACIYMFKEDMKSNKENIAAIMESQNSMSIVQVQQGKDMEQMLQLVQTNQKQTDTALKILARHTGTEIGL